MSASRSSFGRFFILLLLSLLSLGCGSTSESTLDQNVPSSVNTGGYSVVFTAEELAGLFPDPLALPTKLVDPEIASFTLLVYASAGTMVTHASAPHTKGNGYSQSVSGLAVTQYDVILAGRDMNGDLVSAIKAPMVFPLVNGSQLLPPGLFSELQGLILPSGV